MNALFQMNGFAERGYVIFYKDVHILGACKRMLHWKKKQEKQIVY